MTPFTSNNPDGQLPAPGSAHRATAMLALFLAVTYTGQALAWAITHHPWL